MSLQRYRAKRDFARTPEPRGATAQKPGWRFVVQQHAARRMHWDLRLQLDGVLKSWALPKGPSLSPSQRRLAVQTEDHPLAYADFEGTIPKGAYGGGTMIVWDGGQWQPSEDPHRGLAKGHLAFTLSGHKLRGAWHLVRMGGPDSANWLLSKVDDAYAQGLGEVTELQPLSIVSQRRVNLSGETPLPPLPQDLAPQLATVATAPPAGSGWWYEVKLDGYRLLATRVGQTVRLLSRNGHDWTAQLPRLAAAVARLPNARLVLDGELVVLGADGVSQFSGLQEALARQDESQLLYGVFDLLALGGDDLRDRPLRARKAALAQLLAGAKGGTALHYWPHVVGAAAGRRAFAAAQAQSLEGLIAKRADAPYRAGRSHDWLKLKCVQQMACVVGGYLSHRGAPGVRSLLVGQHDAAGDLHYLGRVGTGITASLRRQLAPALVRAARAKSPFVDGPSLNDVAWLAPEVVVQVRYAQITDQGHLRHASVAGLRADKPAHEVLAPQAKPPAAPRARRAAQATPLSHADRPVAPGSKVTKGELAAYLDAVAPLMLADVAGRPLSILRCPEPDLRKNFFHKHLPQGLAGLAYVQIDGKAYACVDQAQGLRSLVQLSALEVHIWGCRVADVEAVDTVVFDLDPGAQVPAAQTVAAAHRLRQVLRQLGFTSCLKATGGKGLHVVVPYVTGCNWQVAKAVGQLVADYVVAQDPKHFTAKMGRAARPGKVFIDYFRNGRGNTCIAPFSPRARPGLPVARPLAWADLDDAVLEKPWDVPTMWTALGRGYAHPWRRLRRLNQPISAELAAAAVAHAAAHADR